MKKGIILLLILILTGCAASSRVKLHMNDYQSYVRHYPTLKSISVAMVREYLKTAQPQPCDEITDIYVRGPANKLNLNNRNTITEQWIALGCDNSYDVKVTFFEGSYEVSVTQFLL